MGSSMSPVMVEIYMNYFENKIMSTVKNEDKIKKWMRYVDDILLIWEGDDEEIKVFFEEVNKLGESIELKMEVGNKEINVLDLNQSITQENILNFEIYVERTYTDGILPNDSYHPIQYKMAEINNLFHRINSCIKDEENRKKRMNKNNFKMQQV